MNKSSMIILLSSLVLLLSFGASMDAMSIAEDEFYTNQYLQYANNMVNEYDDLSSYKNKNYQDREYQSYKQDSNSYVNDDIYKFKDKDRSNSVSISKIKCENI